MFFKKEEPIPDIALSATEFIELNDRLDKFIFQWVVSELKNGLIRDTKMNEIAIFNMKLIYDNCEETNAMMRFMLHRDNKTGDVDNTFNNLQDLFININITFPQYFIESIRKKHINALRLLGYGINDKSVKNIPYGWLFARVQDIIRYRITTKKTTTS